MSNPLKLPSARQPVTVTDPQSGNETFTRPWFLFFQTVWSRVGGGDDTSQDEALLGPVNQEDGGLYDAQQDAGQTPLTMLVPQVEQLQSELASQRDQIAELVKEVQALKQGYQL